MRRLPPSGTTERDRDFTINQLIDGRSNAVGTVTLTAGTTTTTVAKDIFNGDAEPFLFPQTANAATELGNGTIRAIVTAGLLTITHANNGQTDRTFSYAVLGG
jgi:ABC-type amino acid transport substrate-binding protein